VQPILAQAAAVAGDGIYDTVENLRRHGVGTAVFVDD